MASGLSGAAPSSGFDISSIRASGESVLDAMMNLFHSSTIICGLVWMGNCIWNAATTSAVILAISTCGSMDARLIFEANRMEGSASIPKSMGFSLYSPSALTM